MEAKELTALIAYLNVCPKIKGWSGMIPKFCFDN